MKMEDADHRLPNQQLRKQENIQQLVQMILKSSSWKKSIHRGSCGLDGG